MLNVPPLSSYPQATAKLYLKFDGSASMAWMGWASYNVPATPSYRVDGDGFTFSTMELANIREIHARVAEKFSPFNLDVTTVDPGLTAPCLKVIIGGDGLWIDPSLYGFAWTGSFATTGKSKVAFVFSKNPMLNSPKRVAEVVAMVAGQAFGCGIQMAVVDGRNVVNTGDSMWQKAPIMGGDSKFLYQRGLWWDSYSILTKRRENNLEAIASTGNGFGYRSKIGGDAINGTPISIGVDGKGMNTGIITKPTDTDYFSFTTTGGQATITGSVASYGAMLDLKLQLLDSASMRIAVADSASLGETITATLAAGTYYIAVSGHGWIHAIDGNPLDEIGWAADVGQYTISVQLPISVTPVVPLPPPPLPTVMGLTSETSSLTLRWTVPSGNFVGFKIESSFDGMFTWWPVVGLLVKTTSYIVTVSKGFTYQFRICTYDATRQGPWATTPPITIQ